MKALALISVLALIPLAQGADRQFIAADKSPATKVCMAAATGSPMHYHLAVKHSGFNERNVGRALNCNDQPVATFAARYNDDERTVNRIYRYSPRGTKVEITDLAALTSPQGPMVIRGVAP